MSDVQLKPVDEDTLDTILAEDIEFSGTMSFDSPLMIKGRVTGEISTTSDLHIDEKAVVEANITASNVSVRGHVIGNISVQGRVELFSSCRVDGDIRASEITMEPGCQFNGICTMTGKKNA